MLIDTDVLVWMTRGHAGAAARLQALTPWRISAVTYRCCVNVCLSLRLQIQDNARKMGD